MEHPLAHFGLVGCVRGVELAPAEQVVYGSRDVVIVDPRAGEAEERLVLGRERAQEANGLPLGESRRKIQRVRETQPAGDSRIELVDARDTRGREHLGAIRIAVWDERHCRSL